jgi:small subunit ribosomal protein S17
MSDNLRGRRKLKKGVVVSNKMAKTVVVNVSRVFRHPIYGKVVKSSKKYYAHDEKADTLNEGDLVTIVETRPLSKLKRWRVVREGEF